MEPLELQILAAVVVVAEELLGLEIQTVEMVALAL